MPLALAVRVLPAPVSTGPRMKNVNVDAVDDVKETIWVQPKKNSDMVLREVRCQLLVACW